MSDQARPTLVMAMCATMHGIGGGLGWSLVPALMPEMARDLGISHAVGGIVWGAASLGIALASPFGGAAVDRWGARRVAAGAMVFGALACALRAFAASPWQLAALMFLFGAHIGFVAPAIPKALAGHVPLRSLGRANGLAVFFYTLGTAITILTARTCLVPALGGWRHVMLAAGGAMGAAAVGWALLVRDRGVLTRHASVATVLRLARDPQLRRVAGMHFFLFGGYLALLGVLPRALSDAGLPPRRVGVAIASWLIVAAVANFAGPWLSDKLGRRKPLMVAGAAVGGGALGALAIAPASASIGLLVLAALGGGSFAPLLIAVPIELPSIGPAKVGGALGLLMLVGQAGGFVFPALAGVVMQGSGFAAAIALLAVAHLAILVPALRFEETGRASSLSTGSSAPGVVPETA